MGDEAQVLCHNNFNRSVFPFWWMMSGVVAGFFIGLGFVAWYFGPDDFTHDMALVHEGAGALIGGLGGLISGLFYKLKKRL